MRTARLILPVAVLALLAGCGGATEGSDGPTPVSGRVQSEDLPEKARTDDGTKPDDDKADAPASDLAACMLGTWDVDIAALEAVALAGMGPGADAYAAAVEVTGAQVNTIGPDTLTVDYDDQRIAIDMTIEGMQIETVTTLSGELVTDYVLDGDVLTTLGADMTGVAIESLTYVNGVETEIPGYAEQMDTSMASMASVGGEARVTCTADTLTQVPIVAGTEIPDMASTFTRH